VFKNLLFFNAFVQLRNFFGINEKIIKFLHLIAVGKRRRVAYSRTVFREFVLETGTELSGRSSLDVALMQGRNICELQHFSVLKMCLK
jgi:hypothetical protein